MRSERRGEFTFDNKEFIAEMIQSATMKFRYPQLWSKLTLRSWNVSLRGVLQLFDQWRLPESAGSRAHGPEARRGLTPLLSAANRL